MYFNAGIKFIPNTKYKDVRDPKYLIMIPITDAETGKHVKFAKQTPELMKYLQDKIQIGLPEDLF